MPAQSVEIVSDASFYALVHEMVEAEKCFAREGCGSLDQRAAARRPFECQQLLAPFDTVRLPNQSEFRSALCQDLSESGFSFVSPEKVDFDYLVVALGKVPFKFFTAQVQNQSRVRMRGRMVYRVGCRLTGRIVAD
jgi:hypothetical protein